MKNLIFKELQFNKKNVLLSIVIPLVGGIVLGFDEQDYGLMVFYMAWIFTFNFIVGKSCYLDEQGSTLNYLKTLPIKTTKIISVKFILTLITVVQGWGLIHISNYVLKFIGKSGYMIDYKLILLILSIHLLYCGLYLFLFFRFNYSASQYSLFFVFGILALTKMMGSKKLFNITSVNINRFLPHLSAIIALILFVVLWELSKKAFHRRII